ncbi:hypothetical protein [Nocardia sp. CDC160]|uniref:hypothetical protein n=1 Tax=Nocardia sp. CDC160 TaxID=3112166 RepID=UPI002DBE82B1|nr:hypothetical protein [Nocardia sp. CDC160]MEC3913973.1 hypothetical protein [Nocardia sp. CDC160]
MFRRSLGTMLAATSIFGALVAGSVPLTMGLAQADTFGICHACHQPPPPPCPNCHSG